MKPTGAFLFHLIPCFSTLEGLYIPSGLAAPLDPPGGAGGAGGRGWGEGHLGYFRACCHPAARTWTRGRRWTDYKQDYLQYFSLPACHGSVMHRPDFFSTS